VLGSALLWLLSLQKKFRHDSMAHLHPSMKDDEVITIQQMEQILRKSDSNSKSIHAKVNIFYLPIT
jgi:hypothetical protein